LSIVRSWLNQIASDPDELFQHGSNPKSV